MSRTFVSFLPVKAFMEQFYKELERIALSLDTETGTLMASAIRNRSWKDLKQIETDPGIHTPESYWAHEQVKQLLLKAEGLPNMPTASELEKDCVADFYRCEAVNKATNLRLKHIFERLGLETDRTERLRTFVRDVRKDVRDLLGPLPEITEIRARFGPGSTFCRSHPYNTVGDKLSHSPTYTVDAWPFILDWMGTAWYKASHRVSDEVFPGSPLGPSVSGYGQLPEMVRGNRFTTTEKNSFKRRGICVGASLNLFYQLGYGSHIRLRMKRWGLDLLESQARHWEMARVGSRDGSIATIDLSSASDLISRELVKLLLPRRWYTLLSCLREPFTKVNGKWVRLEKFSAMGNGYTFELETLIFHALVRGILRERFPGVDPRDLMQCGYLGQYGDDCIVPSEISEDVLQCFRFFGMQVNVDKTFTMGPFRESCGGDFHSGVDVATFKLKKEPHEPSEWISFANGIWRVANPNVHHPNRWRMFGPVYRRALAALPRNVRRLRGPEHFGDLVVHGFQADMASNAYTAHGITYYWGYLPIANTVPWDHYPPGVVLAAALMGADSAGPAWPAKPVSGYRIRLIGRPKGLKLRRDATLT